MGDDTKRKDRPGDQPMPVPADGPSMHDLVCDDLAAFGTNAGALAAVLQERKALGLARYGTILQAFNGRDALADASDEAADLLVYLRQGIVEAAEGRDESARSQLAQAYHEALRAAMVLAWVRALRRPS